MLCIHAGCRRALCALVGLFIAGALLAQWPTASALTPSAVPEPAFDPSNHAAGAPAGVDALRGALQPPALRDLITEVLDRNPEIARMRHRAAVAALVAPQVRALPDPVAALSLFALPPETRAGPQRLRASIAQRVPWFGTLALRERAARRAAAAARAMVDETRLDQLTAACTIAYELIFLDAYARVVDAERSTLARYENAALARYAAGTGLQQGIVRIQAAITRADTRRLEIDERRAALTADLNRLRDRPADTPAPALDADPRPAPRFDVDALRRVAHGHRPAIAAADHRIAAAGVRIALAEKAFRPAVTFGLAYTAVDRRGDAAARLNPPDDDGDDILALTGSLALPVRRGRLAAGLESARAARRIAEVEKRIVLAEIERAIGDLATRMPLLHRHATLLDTVLRKQAREALRSAETAYSTGKLNAVDLLDAEVVLFEVQIASARTRADLAIAWVALERAVGQPLVALTEGDLP
ncbi:MAG: TolC family protein [Acidobacteriota bacterium]